MIHYHGMPMSSNVNTAKAMSGKHAFISHKTPGPVETCAAVCQSFALDNGAFSYWRQGTPKTDWADYYEWVSAWMRHPGFDWAVIPDVVDGGEIENDALLSEWPYPDYGVPVWHLHESVGRLVRLATEWRRVALGSSGDYAQVGTPAWWRRMCEAIRAIADGDGRPACKLHGLRMLDPRVFSRLPLSSADSSNAGQNCQRQALAMGLDDSAVGAAVLIARIEQHNAAPALTVYEQEDSLFGGAA